MLHLRQDKLLQIDILSQRHPACVDAKDATLGFGVRQRELNLPINPARSDECWVQGLYPIRSHDHLQQIDRENIWCKH